MDKEHLEFCKYWIEERQRIYLKKKESLPHPWTEDLIFQQRRFCNALRDLDRETKWLIDNWLNPLKDSDNLYLAPFIFRIFNQGTTFNDFKSNGIELIEDFYGNKEEFLKFLDQRKLEGKRIFSPAYMVTTHGKKVECKYEYFINHIVPPVINQKEVIKEILHCNSFKESLLSIKKLRLHNFSGFILYQVILDFTYTKFLKDCPDNYEWTIIGPGSYRGLNRIFGREVNHKMKEKQALEECKILMDKMNVIVDKALFKYEFEKLNKKDFNLHDAEFWTCEFDKYLRAKNKQGNVKFYKRVV